MRNYSKFIILLATVCIGSMQLSAEQMDPKKITLTAKAKEQLAGKQILYIEREQYAPDHHNTATLFQKEEINESSFFPGGAMRIFDVNTGNTTTLIELKDGLVRDPELSFDGKKIIFSMRKNKDDFYHIYEINTDGSELKQLTFRRRSIRYRSFISAGRRNRVQFHPPAQILHVQPTYHVQPVPDGSRWCQYHSNRR